MYCLTAPYLHVGQTCWRWNQDLRHVVWNMCLHGSFLHRWTMSSRQMIHTVLAACRSSVVASGYLERERERGREREREVIHDKCTQKWHQILSSSEVVCNRLLGCSYLQCVEISDGLVRRQDIVYALLEVSVKTQTVMGRHCKSVAALFTPRNPPPSPPLSLSPHLPLPLSPSPSVPLLSPSLD